MGVALSLPSLPCHQGDVEYAFEQLDSGSFVASVSVAALEPIAGYPELKKAGSGKIGEDRGRVAGWPTARATEGPWKGCRLRYHSRWIVCHRRFVAHESHSK